MIDEERGKLLRDLGVGQIVNSTMTQEAQIGAVRKQVAKISAALGIELDADFAALEAAVEAAKQ
jgi:hypothetical protein